MNQPDCDGMARAMKPPATLPDRLVRADQSLIPAGNSNPAGITTINNDEDLHTGQCMKNITMER